MTETCIRFLTRLFVFSITLVIKTKYHIYTSEYFNPHPIGGAIVQSVTCNLVEDFIHYAD
jgi:hypothetical protein